MTIATMPVEFADDPIAPHSGQFPLGRLAGTGDDADLSAPSGPDVRPWGLRGMRAARAQGDPVRDVFGYNHSTQTAVDQHGRTLVAEEPSANSNTDADGDEGRSEDWEYDYCPDQPFQV